MDQNDGLEMLAFAAWVKEVFDECNLDALIRWGDSLRFRYRVPKVWQLAPVRCEECGTCRTPLFRYVYHPQKKKYSVLCNADGIRLKRKWGSSPPTTKCAKISKKRKEFFEVEKVLDKQVVQAQSSCESTTYYLVKWKGYDESYNSWVKETDIRSSNPTECDVVGHLYL